MALYWSLTHQRNTWALQLTVSWSFCWLSHAWMKSKLFSAMVRPHLRVWECSLVSTISIWQQRGREDPLTSYEAIYQASDPSLMKNVSPASNCHHWCTGDAVTWYKCTRSRMIWTELSLVSSSNDHSTQGPGATVRGFTSSSLGSTYEGRFSAKAL